MNRKLKLNMKTDVFFACAIVILHNILTYLFNFSCKQAYLTVGKGPLVTIYLDGHRNKQRRICFLLSSGKYIALRAYCPEFYEKLIISTT